MPKIKLSTAYFYLDGQSVSVTVPANSKYLAIFLDENRHILGVSARPELLSKIPLEYLRRVPYASIEIHRLFPSRVYHQTYEYVYHDVYPK